MRVWMQRPRLGRLSLVTLRLARFALPLSLVTLPLFLVTLRCAVLIGVAALAGCLPYHVSDGSFERLARDADDGSSTAADISEQVAPEHDAADVQSPPAAADSSGDQPGTAAAGDYPPALADSTWILRATTPSEQREETPRELPRWQHRQLEDLLSRPPAERPDFRRWLSSDNPVLAANAAICAARANQADSSAHLAAAVREPSLKMAHRMAAAEALGYGSAEGSGESALAAIGLLLEQYGQFGAAGRSSYQPKLHAQLLRALAARDANLFIEHAISAATSPAAEVRLAAIEASRTAAIETYPAELVALAGDPDARIRRGAITALAAAGDPQASALCSHAVSDEDLQVRLAAIDGLGQVAGEKALAVLEKHRENPAEKIRAHVTLALAAARQFDQVLAAAEDTSWHVRLAVAETLEQEAFSKEPSRQAQQVAAVLIDDRSSAVARAVIGSLVRWPLAASGEVYLAGLRSRNQVIRTESWQALAARWPGATGFRPAASAQERAAQLSQLTADWEAAFPQVAAPEQPPAGRPQGALADQTDAGTAQAQAEVRRHLEALSRPTLPEAEQQHHLTALREYGSGLAALLEAAQRKGAGAVPESVYQEALAEVDPVFRALASLEQSELEIRRSVARDLEKLAADRPLGSLAAARLAALTVQEADALVCRSAMTVLADLDSVEVVQLHFALLSHPNAEIRRRGCEYFQAHPQEHGAAALMPLLSDASPAVLLAAIEALGTMQPPESPLPLIRLLASRDKNLVLATASTLAHWQLESGYDALERLTFEEDARVRRSAASAMGQVGQQRFVPALIRLLDDQLGVRRAAMESLTQIVGRDMGQDADGEAASTTEKVLRWKGWHAREIARAARVEPKP